MQQQQWHVVFIQATWRSELTWVHKFWVTHLHITFHSNNSITRWNARKAFPIPPSPFHHHPPINVVPLLQVPVKPTLVWGRCEGTKLCFLFSPKCTLWKYLKNLFASDIVASEKILLLNLIIPWSKDTNSVSIAYICQCNIYMEVIPSQLVLKQVHFCCLSSQSIPKITALSPEATAVPLIIVLAATGVKDAVDDFVSQTNILFKFTIRLYKPDT